MEFFVALIGTLLIFNGQSQQEPYFWEIKKDGKTSYVLGTIHVLPLEDLQCSTKISNQIESSDLVLTELDTAGIKDFFTKQEQNLSKLMQSQSMQEFQSLSPESQNFFKNKIHILKQQDLLPYELDIEQFNYFGLMKMIHKFCELENKDLFERRYSLLDQTVQQQGYGMDKQIQQIAQSQDIPQDYLETSEVRLKAFQPVKNNIQAEHIEQNVAQYDEMVCDTTFIKEQTEKELKIQSEFIEIVKRQYNSGEFTSLDSAVEESTKIPDYIKSQFKSAFNKLFFSGRNEYWLEKIIQSHKENKSVFIAGGAGHFTGAGNVLDMLKAEGFSIQRWTAECKTEEETYTD